MKRFKVRKQLCFAAGMAMIPASAMAGITGFSGFAPVNEAGPTSGTYGYSGSTFTLTDGQGSEAVSGFSSTPQDITAFQASYT